ncbi:hypothetical protein ACH4JS_12520 [Streptomyces sp. NPDC017638]|uniref:hypothetical protein n=1 Tax=Streptomyces sp. NPDC017638 TaxID=3365004 RepID=UPI0037963C89
MPVGARAVHWPDLVVVEPTSRFPIAVEAEPTPRRRSPSWSSHPKAPAALRTLLRAYRRAQHRVLYVATDPVVRQLQDGPGPGGA